MQDQFKSVRRSYIRITPFTFLKGFRYPHWFHFGQISRVEVVEKHEATADNILGRARHDASDGCVKLRLPRNRKKRDRRQRIARSCGIAVHRL